MSFKEGFCGDGGYQPHPKVEDYINTPGSDPKQEFHGFHEKYHLWMKDVDDGGGGRDPDVSVMAFFFQGTDDAEHALKAGDGVAEGRVIKQDCDAFVNFVEVGQAELIRIAEASPEDTEAFLEKRGRSGISFEDAVNAYISGQDLAKHPFARGLLNGACFLRNERSDTDLSGGEVVTTVEFYAVPGPDMFFKYRRNLNKPFWRGVMESLKEASDSANMPMINLDLAMQLRLGRKGQQLPPQNIGSGLVIFGAG